MFSVYQILSVAVENLAIFWLAIIFMPVNKFVGERMKRKGCLQNADSLHMTHVVILATEVAQVFLPVSLLS